jgi:toxin ParE1/3/4
MAARISAAARERLLEIWDYTEKTWSEEQADTYVRELVAAINAIAGERHRWRSVMDDALPNVFFFRHQHHYIFFRELPKGTVGIVSILHENMDIPSHLRQDSERDIDA